MLLLVRPGAPSSFLLLVVRHLFLIANIVTTSKALLTRSVALVTRSVALVTRSVALVTRSVALVTRSVALVTRSVALVTRSVALVTSSNKKLPLQVGHQRGVHSGDHRRRYRHPGAGGRVAGGRLRGAGGFVASGSRTPRHFWMDRKVLGPMQRDGNRRCNSLADGALALAAQKIDPT